MIVYGKHTEMVGDNEVLKELANRMVCTYSLYELLEINDMTDEELVYLLLINGLITQEVPVEL